MKVSLMAVGLSLTLGLAACGGPLKFQVPSSKNAPGADAQIVADVKQEQGLTQLEIEARNLPPPGRVQEGATSFIVWQRKSPQAQWARLGGLQYDEDTRKGTWSGTVPETGFDLNITTEKASDVASPSGDTVFKQRVN